MPIPNSGLQLVQAYRTEDFAPSGSDYPNHPTSRILEQAQTLASYLFLPCTQRFKGHVLAVDAYPGTVEFRMFSFIVALLHCCDMHS
jgi:hypothetical protein